MLKQLITSMFILLAACVSHSTVNMVELERNATSGDTEAQYNLATALMKNGRSTDAVKWYKLSAERGHAEAQNNLGVFYQHGRVVPQDSQKAFYWYKKSAEQGISQAEHNVAWMYDQGLGTKEDNQEAVYWYRRAAKHGVPAAQLNLGIMLGKGEGAPQNHVEAHKWLTSARLNDIDKQAQWSARGALCELEANMTEIEIKEAGYSYTSMPFSNCESYMTK